MFSLIHVLPSYTEYQITKLQLIRYVINDFSVTFTPLTFDFVMIELFKFDSSQILRHILCRHVRNIYMALLCVSESNFRQ